MEGLGHPYKWVQMVRYSNITNAQIRQTECKETDTSYTIFCVTTIENNKTKCRNLDLLLVRTKFCSKSPK